MASKDDRPGLLSKVAMFVRNPTRDWSELDQPTEADAVGYDKQALKAMIERKRQNDFIRKREFDQLRKLRSRDPVALAAVARSSFFQTSLANDIDGRAVTLKKIDEIEAQMSRQWWKSRGQEAQAPEGQGASMAKDASGLLNDESQPYQGAADASLPFAATEPMSEPPRTDEQQDEFAPTLMASDAMLEPLSLDPRRLEPGVGLPASAHGALEEEEMTTDPELEEAAIRFANGDDAGAEAGLLGALRGPGVDAQSAQAWASALLDFYRAVNNRQGFENAANEFSLYLNAGWPVWSQRHASSGTAAENPHGLAAGSEAGSPLWSAPPQLSAGDMEALSTALLTGATPWYLSWGALEGIDADAMPLLNALFERLCFEAVTLRFEGSAQLARALQQVTPSAVHQVDRVWWHARLNALRAMGLQDDFELAALDYCVTYEVAPPAWTPAMCSMEVAPSALPARSEGGAATPAAPTDQAATASAAVLRGDIRGDAAQALALLDAAQAQGESLHINCQDLVRVDFAAAGSILNWVLMRQSEGRQVQFQNMHSLVAAFFMVIGINEYAKVMRRAR